MLHRSDLPGSAIESPQMDDYYYYLAVGDLALPAKNFFVDKPVVIQNEEESDERR